jgi:flagellar biosynthetic protein FlhB
MAEEMGQERTERATPKRVEEARKRGELPRSGDLNTAAVMLVGAGGLYFTGTAMGGSLRAMMGSALQIERDAALDESLLPAVLGQQLLEGFLACAPVLGLITAAALLAPLALGGWNLSTEALAPDFGRLNPLAGFKRMFSIRGVVELTKAFAKFVVVALVAILFLRREAPTLLQLGREPVHAAIGHSALLAGQALLVMAGALVLIAAVDVPWQLWQYNRNLRMSREEIREEMKETEGSPELKGRIRAAQQAISRRRMMQAVPTADVVVVNPTHYSVALRYEEGRMRAPTVVAKGTDLVALRIREIATENGVPILEAPPLARALHRSVEIGSEIPANLYAAVAQVLTYVYQLRAARTAGTTPPPAPRFDAVPDPDANR